MSFHHRRLRRNLSSRRRHSAPPQPRTRRSESVSWTGLSYWAIFGSPRTAARFVHRTRGSFFSTRLTQRPERSSQLRAEKHRLFPGREVAAPVELVVIDEFWIRPFRPAPRGRVDLVRKDAHGNGNGDVFDVEEGQLVFPIQTRRRDRCVRQPIERDVVEDVVSREAAGLRLSFEDACDELVTTDIVVKYPRRQA